MASVSKVGIMIVNIGQNNPLYNDPEVILAAAKDSYPGAVVWAGKALKNDPEFVQQAMAIDPLTLCFVNKRFRADPALWKQMQAKYPKERCNHVK